MRIVRGVLIASLLTAPLLSAQRSGVVPGAVATTTVVISRTGARATAGTFTIRAANGVRVFGDTTGAIGDAALPITFSVAATRPSGALDLARVLVRWADGDSSEFTARALIEPLHSLRVVFQSDLRAISARRAQIDVMITNAGNVADTTHLECDAGILWIAECGNEVTVLAPGASVTRSAFVSWPANAHAGELRILRVSAIAGVTRAQATTMVRAVASSVDAAAVIRAPSQLFLGSSLERNNSRPAVAFSSSAQLAPDATLNFGLRDDGTSGRSRVFADEMNGRRYQLDLNGSSYSIQSGDVMRMAPALIGGMASGRGVGADFAVGSGHAGMLFTRGSATNGTSSRDAMQLEGAWQNALGSVGINAATLGASPLSPDLHTARTLGGSFTHASASGRGLWLSAGVVGIADSAGQHDGAAADLLYAGDIGPTTSFIHLRRVPSLGTNRDVQPSASSLGITLPVKEQTTLSASAAHSLNSSIYAVSATQQVGGAGILQFGVNRREVTSLALSFRAPISFAELEGSAESGVGDSTFRQLHGGIRFSGSHGWVWSGVSYAKQANVAATRRAESSGALIFGRTVFEFGLDAGSWARLNIPVVTGLSLVVGIDRGSSPIVGNSWRTMLGVNRGLDITLPIHRRALVHGVVFDDRNGNGRQDEGEPGLSGVTVRLGDDERTTSASGEFAFSDWSLRGQRVELDPASIPQQFMSPQRPLPVAVGTIAIPLVRSGALTVMLRAPRGDASAAFEEDSFQSCGVSLVASDGRTHEVAVDNGIARFGAIAAGNYLLVLTGEETERRQRIQVPAGDATHIDLSCPGARLTRFGPTASR